MRRKVDAQKAALILTEIKEVGTSYANMTTIGRKFGVSSSLVALLRDGKHHTQKVEATPQGKVGLVAHCRALVEEWKALRERLDAISSEANKLNLNLITGKLIVDVMAEQRA